MKAITPCPAARGPVAKSVPVFPVSPVEVLKGRRKVSAEPSLLQAEQGQLSQPFVTGEVFHPSDGVCGPRLDPLQEGRAFLVLRTPEPIMSRSKAGWKVENVEERRAEEVILVAVAQAWQRFCKEVEASGSSGRCKREER